MKAKITKHTTIKPVEYYSVEYPKGVSMAAIARYLGVTKMAVSFWRERIPKSRIKALLAIPDEEVQK